jgi:hypothetical protein
VPSFSLRGYGKRNELAYGTVENLKHLCFRRRSTRRPTQSSPSISLARPTKPRVKRHLPKVAMVDLFKTMSSAEKGHDPFHMRVSDTVDEQEKDQDDSFHERFSTVPTTAAQLKERQDDVPRDKGVFAKVRYSNRHCDLVLIQYAI